MVWSQSRAEAAEKIARAAIGALRSEKERNLELLERLQLAEDPHIHDLQDKSQLEDSSGHVSSLAASRVSSCIPSGPSTLFDSRDSLTSTASKPTTEELDKRATSPCRTRARDIIAEVRQEVARKEARENMIRDHGVDCTTDQLCLFLGSNDWEHSRNAIKGFSTLDISIPSGPLFEWTSTQ